MTESEDRTQGNFLLGHFETFRPLFQFAQERTFGAPGDQLLAARASRDLRPGALRRGASVRPISAAASSSSVSVNIADGPPVHEGTPTSAVWWQAGRRRRCGRPARLSSCYGGNPRAL